MYAQFVLEEFKKEKSLSWPLLIAKISSQLISLVYESWRGLLFGSVEIKSVPSMMNECHRNSFDRTESVFAPSQNLLFECRLVFASPSMIILNICPADLLGLLRTTCRTVMEILKGHSVSHVPRIFWEYICTLNPETTLLCRSLRRCTILRQ